MLADLRDLFLVFVAGLVVGWFLKEVTGQTVKAKAEVTNTETWDMWEDEEGHIRAVVKRRVRR